MPIATVACCGLHIGLDPSSFFLSPTNADRPCEYMDERLTYLSNVNRCTSLGGYECDFEGYEHWTRRNSECIDNLSFNSDTPQNNLWSWTVSSTFCLFLEYPWYNCSILTFFVLRICAFIS